MSHFFEIHPDNPQARLLRNAANIIHEGGIVILPTDSGYALGCKLGNKQALERIKKLRQLDKNHNMSLLCANLAQLGFYAKVPNPIFRLLKAFTPGSYTFILTATKEVPRLMLHPKRRTLGIRIPAHNIALSLLDVLEEPLMSTSLILPGSQVALSESDAIKDLLGKHVDLIINGGNCGYDPTTIVDLTGNFPQVVREGKGDPMPFK